MTDKTALLAAIMANPRDDLARLAYADWLDENETSDQAKATAEFVRVSCPPRGTAASHTIMPQKAYRWLDSNWWRLVPSLTARHVEPGADSAAGAHLLRIKGSLFRYSPHGHTANGIPWRRGGRSVYFNMGLWGANHPASPRRWYTPSMMLTFWKGFAVVFGYFSDWAFKEVITDLTADQPLLGTDPY